MNRFFVYIIAILFSICQAYALEDVFADTYINKESVEKPFVHTEYDYSSLRKIPIRLSICEYIKDSTVYEGQVVDFKIENNVLCGGKIILKRNTIVPARVETIITSGMNGIPASIILGNFEIPNIQKGQLDDTYEVKGQDRSLLVFPLKWALTILPPTGSLTNFIKGGQARLRPSKIIKIYYYPERI